MSKVLFLFGLWAVLAPATPGPTDTDKTSRTPVLLELFTSEGCSSCPPADRLLETLDRMQPAVNVDLIVLSEHVDYWNGGGWADPYSSKLFTARQDRYAEQFGLQSVYTPQRVVDGQFEGVGSNLAGAKADIEKAADSRKVPLALSNVTRSANQIQFRIASPELGTHGKEATLYIAIAQDRVRSDVRHGENAGRSITHVAVVRALMPVGSVKSSSAFSRDLILNIPASVGSLSSGMRLVAFLQVDKTQKIIGATKIEL